MKKIDVEKFNKRQKCALVGILAVLLVITAVIMWQTRTDNSMSQFELSASVYGKAGIEEISASEYAEKLEAGESFLVLAHATACPAGMPLTDLAKNLAREYNMTIYGLMQEEFRDSSLAQEVKFLPSLAIVRQGRVVKFLNAESDADLPAYQSLDGLKDWLKQYIKL